MTPSNCWSLYVDWDEMTMNSNGLWRKILWPVSRYSSSISVERKGEKSQEDLSYLEQSIILRKNSKKGVYRDPN
jgi:hypothetical protein